MAKKKKKKYRIEYLKVAQDDLFEIIDYIKKDNPTAAADFIDGIDSTITKLSTFPELGKVPRDDRLRLLGYRILIFGNYLVFYVVKDYIVEIRRIIHGKRRYEFLF